MECYVKIHDSLMGNVVGVCDKELLGKSFREGNVHIDVNEDFYGGVLMTIEEALEIIRSCFTANLVGERIVSAAIDEGIIDEDMVLYIQDVPHAQVVYIS